MAGVKLLMFMLAAHSAGQAMAYPWLWAQNGGNSGSPAPPACTAHPAVGDISPIPHGKVITDISTTYTLSTDQDNTPVKPGAPLCPGQKYALTLNFGSDPRRGLLTATVIEQFGSWLPPSNTPQPPPYNTMPFPCPNRVFIGFAGTVPTYQDGFQVPCNTGGKTELVLQLTTGTAAGVQLQDISWKFTIDPTCAVASVCASGATGAPPPSTPPTPSTPATPAATPGPKETETEGGSKGPAKPTIPVPPAGCPPSPLGYTCQQQVGSVIVHSTVGAEHPSSSPCFPGKPAVQASNLLPAGKDANSDLVHMAIEASTNGWVGFGFARSPGSMPNTDIILGWISGSTPYVKTFKSTSNGLSDGDASAWALTTGIVRNNDKLVMCFTRRLNEPQAANSQVLDITKSIGVNWAIKDSATELVQHDSAAGGSINLATGVATTVTSKLENKIRLHGALMALAWALLLPLGTLLPRHRWVFGKAQCCGKDAWFPMHVGLQFTGMLVMTISFIGAWVWFSVEDTVGKIHRLVGTIVFAMAWLQIVGAFFRPRPDHPRRGVFNVFHHWLGRITVVAAWGTIYLGIITFHQGIYKAPYTHWLIPVFVCMLLIIIIDIILTIAARRRGWEVSSPRGKGPKGGKALNTVSMQPVLKNGTQVDLAVKTNPAYKPMAARDSNIV